MYPFLHRLLATTYAVLPVAAWVWAIRRTVRLQRFEPLASFLITCFSGVILGTVVVIPYTVVLHGRVLAWEILQSWYFLTGLLLLLGIFRRVIRGATWALLRVERDDRGRPKSPDGWRASVALGLQAVVLLALGLPFVTAALLVHRVPVYSGRTPTTLAGCDSEDVTFPATDGTRIAGWWVPARAPRDDSAAGRTVLMCFDLGDDMKRQAGLLRVLASGGYNVLAFDLRGSGASGGQWAGAGDLERRDVFGAVRWLRANHTEACGQIFGVGGGIGGAALVAAATDPAAEGQAIKAVALYDTFADFETVARAAIEDRVSKPFRNWGLRTILPIASAHAGSDLVHFSPARLVPQLWPRPVLVLHGNGDRIVPLSEGHALFHAATFPKRAVWVSGDHAGVYRSRRGAAAVLDFFDNAEAIPAI